MDSPSGFISWVRATLLYERLPAARIPRLLNKKYIFRLMAGEVFLAGTSLALLR